MKKFYLREEERNEEEKRTGKASYKSIVTRYIDDMVLCNNVAEIDNTIWDNFNYQKPVEKIQQAQINYYGGVR